MRVTRLTQCVLAISSLLVLGGANAQSIVEYADHWMDPNEFLLSSAADTETLRFDTRRPVRVCLANVGEDQTMPTMAAIEPPEDTPLRIERSVGSTIILQAGTCVDFAAQSIELSPVGSVPDNWSLRGTVHSRRPMS